MQTLMRPKDVSMPAAPIMAASGLREKGRSEGTYLHRRHAAPISMIPWIADINLLLKETSVALVAAHPIIRHSPG